MKMLQCEGHTVTFDSEGSFIRHKTTGKVIDMIRVNDVFEVEFEVVPFACSPFSRRANPL